jgi:integrase
MNFKPAKLFDADGDITHRWFVYYFFRDPDTNKWVRFRFYISSRLRTRSERYNRSREMIKLLNRKLAIGHNPFIAESREHTAILNALDHFIESKKYLRNRTVISYRSYVKDFKNWLNRNHYESMAIEGLTYHTAQEYMDEVGSRPITNRTFNNILQGVRTCFNFLVEQEYLIVNPFSKIHQRQVEDTEIIAFNNGELELISKTLPGYNFDLYVIALLIFNCFLRPQEIVRLRVRHFRDAKDFLTIPGDVSKNKKNEAIAITPSVKKALSKLDLNYPGDWFIFSSHLKRGKRQMMPTRITEAWNEYKRKYGIEKNIYSLKHTGNGLALEMGANARDLQLQNRHSNLEQTQKYLDRFRRIPTEKFRQNFPSL